MAEDKSKSCTVPAVKVTLGEQDVVEDLGGHLEKVEVNLELRGESSAEILLWGCYDADKHTVQSQLKGVLKPGSILEVFLGYESSLKKVFSGYLHRAEIEISETGEAVRLTGCDVVRLMKDHRHTRAFQKDTLSAVFEEVMEPYSWLCTAQADATDPLAQGEVRMQSGDDYQYVTEALAGAESAGWEFFVQSGKACFVKEEKKPDSVMTIKPDSGVLKLSASWGFLNKTISVQGCGADHGVFGAEQPAKADVLDGKAGEAVDFQYLPCLDSEAKVKAWAASEAGRLKRESKKAFISLAGAPELQAGKYVELQELDSLANGQYRIIKARHLLDEDGYRTEAELEGG